MKFLAGGVSANFAASAFHLHTLSMINQKFSSPQLCRYDLAHRTMSACDNAPVLHNVQLRRNDVTVPPHRSLYHTMQEVTSLGVIGPSPTSCPASFAGKNFSKHQGSACWYSTTQKWLNTEADSLVLGVDHTYRGSLYSPQPCSIRHAITGGLIPGSHPGMLLCDHPIDPACLKLRPVAKDRVPNCCSHVRCPQMHGRLNLIERNFGIVQRPKHLFCNACRMLLLCTVEYALKLGSQEYFLQTPV